MKTKRVLQILALVLIGFGFLACEDETTTTSTIIPASYLDTMQWTETWLVIYSDESMGFDFSANEYVSSDRDCYLEETSFKYINTFLFEGENRLKMFGAINPSVPLTVPETWDETNSMLQVGSYYVAQCKDGYVVFKVNGYMSCCGEFVIKFSFVPDSALETSEAMTKSN